MNLNAYVCVIWLIIKILLNTSTRINFVTAVAVETALVCSHSICLSTHTQTHKKWMMITVTLTITPSLSLFYRYRSLEANRKASSTLCPVFAEVSAKKAILFSSLNFSACSRETSLLLSRSLMLPISTIITFGSLYCRTSTNHVAKFRNVSKRVISYASTTQWAPR